MSALETLQSAERIVVKVGSSLLARADGMVRQAWLDQLAADIAARQKSGQRVAVVSSGAIAVGRRLLGLDPGSLRLDVKQAAAAAGQIRLAQAWAAALAGHGVAAAQILLTQDDTEDRRRYLNARSTFDALMRLGVVPVVNENDSIATAEIRFGDNDRLSARVAVMISAELLVLLSDVDGLYTANPAQDPKAEHLPDIARIDERIAAMAGGAGSDVGTGGMISKIEAARIATRAGCATLITDGRSANPLRGLEEGARHTVFRATGAPESARKFWIAASLGAMGAITVDEGAKRALENQKSLLPAGVTKVEGAFSKGDAVIVRGPDGDRIAKGLSAYDARDANRIKGRKSAEIETILGYRGRDELIHKDDLAML